MTVPIARPQSVGGARTQKLLSGEGRRYQESTVVRFGIPARRKRNSDSLNDCLETSFTSIHK